jgi:hypothetical protein
MFFPAFILMCLLHLLLAGPLNSSVVRRHGCFILPSLLRRWHAVMTLNGSGEGVDIRRGTLARWMDLILAEGTDVAWRHTGCRAFFRLSL